MSVKTYEFRQSCDSLKSIYDIELSVSQTALLSLMELKCSKQRVEESQFSMESTETVYNVNP